MLNRIVELIMIITFAHEILPVDGVWSCYSFIYEELRDIFKENKHGFDGKSHTLTHLGPFWRTYVRQNDIKTKSLAESLRSLLLTALYSLQFSALIWGESITIQQQ